MKAIYRLFILLNIFFFSYTALFSQKPFKNLGKVYPNLNVKSNTDTIMPESFYTGTLTLDTSLNGGYVSGTNGHGDLAKAQIFDMPENYSYFVKGIGLLVGALDINAPTAILTLGIHAIDGQGYFENGFDTAGAPGYIYSHIDVPSNLLVNNQLNIIEFPAEVFIQETYALSVSFENFENNIIGLVSTSSGDADSSEHAWEKTSDGHWYSMLNAWGWDADMGIFSIINAETAYSTNKLKQELSVTAYPNPLTGHTLNLEILSETEEFATIDVFDISGRIVKTYTPVQISTGKQNIKLNIENITTGSYLVRIRTKKQNIIKKVSLL